MYKLDVNYDEVARYLGTTVEMIDNETHREIRDVVDELKQYVDYKVEHRIVDVKNEEQGLKVIGTNLVLEGSSIQELLKDSSKCIFMAVTLGQRVEQYLRRLQVMNLNRAIIADFCASSMVEHLCNQINQEWKEKWLLQNQYLTDRFSPGYGDLSIYIQKQLCEILDTSRKIGLSVTSSGIMIPRKSITAIIGISDVKQKMKIRGCKYCDFYKECNYRKKGRNCNETNI